MIVKEKSKKKGGNCLTATQRADVRAEVTARRFNQDRTFVDCKAPAIRLYLVSWGKHPTATWMVWCYQPQQLQKLSRRRY